MSEAQPLLSPGLVVAETWEIERQLGRGGMGEVWLAKNRRLAGKLVAIKVLHVDRDLPQEALARFKREAEIAARLEHPNIVQVLDFNTLPTGQPFLVMEYLKGSSLALRARGRTLDLSQVANIMRQVGAALQAAHRAGVVHRDLKPENIFLVPTAAGDQVKVLDFGISKLSDSNTVKTTDSVLIGTPLYMSPEQALGQNSDVSPQSDLFSLGSICYELFTGNAPFVADNIAKVVFRIAYEKHAPLSQLRPDLPANAVAAVEHALEKERSKRTPSIDAFVHELTGEPLAVVQDETSGVYAPGMPETPSMSGGATRAPSSSGGRPMATPSPVSAPTPAPIASDPMAGAKTVSGKKVIIGMVVAAFVIASIVAKVRTDNWKERTIYRQGMIDAGYTLLADGTFDLDAGPKRTVELDAGAEPMDASVALAEVTVDAGVEGPVDAGAAATAPKPKAAEVPPTPLELELLERFTKLEQDQKWDLMWEQRSRLRTDLKTPGAREKGLAMLIRVACQRGENTQLRPVLSEYRSVASPAQVKQAKQACIARYPSAEFIDW